MELKNRYFIKKTYCGSDGENFKSDFVEYLKSILKEENWYAMSEYKLFLQGAKKALEEIVQELE